MIGIIPHVVDAYVLEKHGDMARERLREQVGLPSGHAFRLNADYSDPLCRRIVVAAIDADGGDAGLFFERFADFFFSWTLNEFRGFFDGVASARQFLLRQPTIHNCLAAGLSPTQRRAVDDKFAAEPTEAGLTLTYRSPNRLGAFYVALARRVARHYGERAEITIADGTLDGPFCVFEVVLTKLGAIPVKEDVHVG